MTRVRTSLFVGAAVILIGIAGTYGYLLLVKDDAPSALDSTDLEQALTNTTDSSTAPASSAPASSAPDSAAPTQPLPEPTDRPSVDPSGTWTISTDSMLGYRVSEVLGGVDTEGAGRTNQVTGTLTIEGSRATAAEFIVDMASITSDSDRRDNQFRSRIMSTDEFPTATFRLTEPIDFGVAPTDGQPITASATGVLTLRGVTRDVSFDVEAQLEDGRIGVLGNIPITFSDYAIPDPSNGFALVKDTGLLEFVLVFDRT